MSLSTSGLLDITWMMTWTLVVEAVREQRAERAVDQAADQDLALGRTTFTLEESAGDAAGGVELFHVVDGQGKKSCPGLAILGGHHGGTGPRCRPW
jgi:hypothetical protein